MSATQRRWSQPPIPTIGDASTATDRAANPDGWAFDPDHITAFDAVLRARRDVRRFRPDPLPDHLFRSILQAGHAAPSVGHSQPWRFVVIRDQSTRDKAAWLADQARLDQAAAMTEDAARQLLDLQLEGIREAPLGVVLCCDRRTQAAGVLGRNTFTDADMWSCACAIQNMWLAARARGVGMGWVTLFDPTDLTDLIDAPDGVQSLGWLCFGYPDERHNTPGLERAGWSHRAPLDDVIFDERYDHSSAAPTDRSAPTDEPAAPPRLASVPTTEAAPAPAATPVADEPGDTKHRTTGVTFSSHHDPFADLTPNNTTPTPTDSGPTPVEDPLTTTGSGRGRHRKVTLALTQGEPNNPPADDHWPRIGLAAPPAANQPADSPPPPDEQLADPPAETASVSHLAAAPPAPTADDHVTDTPAHQDPADHPPADTPYDQDAADHTATGPTPDAVVAARDTAAAALTPPGSLGLVDKYLEKIIACIPSNTPPPAHLIVAAADHHVADLGVTAYSRTVTADVIAASRAGQSCGARAAHAAGIDYHIVDCGTSSGDLADTDTLTTELFNDLLAQGQEWGEHHPDSIIALGDVGMGNSTVGAAVTAGLLRVAPDRVVGLGANADADMLRRKQEIIERGLLRLPDNPTTSNVVCTVGGPEVAYLMGVALGVANAGGVVVTDGLVSSVAVLAACTENPSVARHVVAGQRSRERGHTLVLAELGLEPLLDVRLRSGEGIGAVLATQMLRSALMIRMFGGA